MSSRKEEVVNALNRSTETLPNSIEARLAAARHQALSQASQPLAQKDSAQTIWASWFGNGALTATAMASLYGVLLMTNPQPLDQDNLFADLMVSEQQDLDVADDIEFLLWLDLEKENFANND